MKETNENIIDLGEWKVPSSWDEITLKKFQEIERYYDDKDRKFDVREVLHILTDKTIDEVNALPAEFLEKILEKLTFLTEEPEQKEPTNRILIDGEEYIINTMEKLKTGEYVQCDTVMKADSHNYAAILAILCRKEGEIYDSRFEAEVLDSRIAMFEKQPVMDILPLIGFFLTSYAILSTPSLLSSRARELIDLTRSDIENLRRNGEIGRRSMRSLMKRLSKLEKSINSI